MTSAGSHGWLIHSACWKSLPLVSLPNDKRERTACWPSNPGKSSSGGFSWTSVREHQWVKYLCIKLSVHRGVRQLCTGMARREALSPEVAEAHWEELSFSHG